MGVSYAPPPPLVCLQSFAGTEVHLSSVEQPIFLWVVPTTQQISKWPVQRFLDKPPTDLFVCLLVCLLVGWLVGWFVCLFASLFAFLLQPQAGCHCLFAPLFVCGCFRLCLFARLPACLPACLSACQSIFIGWLEALQKPSDLVSTGPPLDWSAKQRDGKPPSWRELQHGNNEHGLHLCVLLHGLEATGICCLPVLEGPCLD